MTRKLFASLLILMLVACLAPLSALAQTQAGAIKLALATGSVSKIAAGTTQAIPIKNGDPLIETDTVVTGKDSSVVVVFANGSSVKLGPNSRLAIDEFKMDPLGETIAVADLKAEPTVSKTRLNLAYGEIVGNVKKLNTTAGSSFDVKTAVGAAGIRGTTFRIVMRFDSAGQASFQLNISEGRVAFTATVQVSSDGTTTQEGGTTEVLVADGQEVTATVTVDPVTNQVTAVQLSSPQPLSTEATQAITTAVTEAIQQAQSTTTFTQTDQQQAANNTTNSTTTGGSQQSSNTTQQTDQKETPASVS